MAQQNPLWWFLLIPATTLSITGVHNRCFLYKVLGINTSQERRNRYLSYLPQHNPEPVYIFNTQGKLVFCNDVAQNLFPDLSDITELGLPKQKLANENIIKDETFYETVEIADQTYLVHFKAVSEIESILAYAFNVTDVVRMNKEIIQTQKELVYRMGEIGETRSKETGNHVKRVAEFSYLLATLAGLSEMEAETLKMASPMHDIGKVAIPDAILNKPAKLDPPEWSVMKGHSSIGHELLRHSDRPILKAAAIVAGQHHERWEGNGYPYGLKGEDIHIYGRITAIADVFDALASERVYKKAWPLEKILSLFKTESGKQFDPQLMKLFLDNLNQFLTIRDRHKDFANT
ncbi:MAG: HD domain-containing protein [Magnetococcales bacterium]|nr:HD domain-containing protein [Magnetococcales bacterium]